MKHSLKIAGIIILNLGLLFVSLLIYYRFAEKIDKVTNNPYGIETFITVILLLTGIVLSIRYKNYRIIGLGATSTLISSMIFLVFYINKNFSNIGEFTNLPLKESIWNDNGFFLKINYNKHDNWIKVSQEKCLNIDTINVRIDKGLFGMDILTNDIKVIQGISCDHKDIDTNDILESHKDIGHELAEKRCFSDAIYHYSICSKLDSLNPDYYYHKGLMYMVQNNYKNALTNFFFAASVRYNNLDSSVIKNITNEEYIASGDKLLKKIKDKDYKGISSLVEKINIIDNFETYQTRINYCFSKSENE